MWGCSSGVNDPVAEESELERILVEGVDVGGVGVRAFQLGKEGQGSFDLTRREETKRGLVSEASRAKKRSMM